jgi:phage baseplate assembly protein V
MDAREEKKISDKVRNGAATRIVLGGVDDGKKMQEAQAIGLDGEAIDGVERIQDYGFSSCPPAGAEAIGLPVGGDRSHMVIVKAEDRGLRMGGLASLDVCVYRAGGDYFHLKDGNKIELKTKELFIDAEKVIITGDVEIRGALTVTGGVSAGGLVNGSEVRGGNVTLTTHKHTGDSGGTTDKPIGGT